MHVELHNNLSKATFLLQFFGWLARGKFTMSERQGIYNLISLNAERCRLMQDDMNWDGRYDLVMKQEADSLKYIEAAKGFLEYKQICSDKEICDFVYNHPDFMTSGIILNDLKQLLNVDRAFRLGHLLHDVYHGYPSHHYIFQIDCFDYLHSAAHFYNEGYDYFFGRKTIKNYSEIDSDSIHWTEQKRIQSSEEVAFRNFREAFINLVFFVESFINSVGLHAYLQGIGKDEIEKMKLKGIESISRRDFKNYSNLKQRISNISRIISGNALDINQQPFKTYFQQSVELRNQYVHSSVDKPKSIETLESWKLKCDQMIDNDCMELLRKFWAGCYQNTQFPIIIANSFDGNSFKGRPGKLYADPG